MRFVTWNCCGGFSLKYPHLRDLDFDVAVVCECGPFEAGLADSREVTSVLQRAADQPRYTKHIGVLARDPWHADHLPARPDQPWLLPVRISGPLDFTVFAFWALDRDLANGLSYTAQLQRVIQDPLLVTEGPVVVAGDLNAPISTSIRQHAANVGGLRARGLVSAFTTARGNVNPLTEPTLYHQRKLTQPFHIDHVFVPAEWTSDLSVSIGSYDDWVATKRSDHVPVVVDLKLPEA